MNKDHYSTPLILPDKFFITQMEVVGPDPVGEPQGVPYRR